MQLLINLSAAIHSCIESNNVLLLGNCDMPLRLFPHHMHQTEIEGHGDHRADNRSQPPSSVVPSNRTVEHCHGVDCEEEGERRDEYTFPEYPFIWLGFIDIESIAKNENRCSYCCENAGENSSICWCELRADRSNEDKRS